MSRTAPPETDDAAGDAVVELRDVSVVFGMERGESRVLDEINIDVGRNEIPGIVGEAGGGKTTLGKTAVAFERPTGGAVRYRGHDVWTAHERLYRVADGELDPFDDEPDYLHDLYL